MDGQRLDQWLWHARFAKTRALCARLVAGRKVRLNGRRVEKPAQPVRIGDVLTLSVGGAVRVVRVAGFGTRRGPASEATLLYEDLSGPEAT